MPGRAEDFDVADLPCARRHAEIEELHAPFFVDHHVPGGDVAMYDAASMRVIEGARDLEGDVRPLFGGEGAARVQELGEGAPPDQLHDQIEDSRLDTELEDRDDVRVRQPHARLRLVDEPSNERLVRRELGADELHDELLLEPFGARHRREEDVGHPAAREPSLQEELPEGAGETLHDRGRSPLGGPSAQSRNGGLRARRGHRTFKPSNVFPLAVVASLAVACSAPSPGERPIEAHALAGCGLDDVTRIDLEALDDRAPSASSFAEVDPRGASPLPLLASDTERLVARGLDAGGTLVALGLLRVDATGADGAIFRTDRACTLAGDRLTTRDTPAIGGDARGALLAGGRDPNSGRAVADALFVEADLARATHIPSMLRARADAMVLPMDAAFVVAGGRDDDLWADAERLSIGTADGALAFDASPILLNEARAEAGAVVLANGDGLLVGGAGRNGALASMESIDASTFRARTLAVSLAHPRRALRALRLATGEIAIAGGVDDGGAPVADIERFSADASTVLPSIPFPARAFVDAIALPSGSILVAASDAIGGPIDLSLVRGDAVVEPLTTLAAGGTVAPTLIAATDGSPFLYDGALHRVDLWNAAVDDDVAPPDVGTHAAFPPFTLDGGVLAFARDDAGSLDLLGYRYDARNTLSIDDALGLGSNAHLSPDRRTGLSLTRVGVTLPPSGRLAVTDTDYGAFTLQIGAGGRDLPIVELRDARGALLASIGTTECAWPAVSADSAVVARAADGTVTATIASSRVTCGNVDVARRASIVLAADASGAQVQGILLTRGS